MKTLLEYIQKKKISKLNVYEEQLDGEYSFSGKYEGTQCNVISSEWKKLFIYNKMCSVTLFITEKSGWVFYIDENNNWAAFWNEKETINKIKKNPEKFYDILEDIATLPEFKNIMTNLPC